MKPSQREDEEMLVDGEDVSDDENQDAVPLMMSSDDASSSSALRQRRQRQRLKSLEIVLRAEEDEAYYPSCLGDSWRLLASLLLASLMAAPLLLRHFRVSSDWPSDSLPCAQSYGISYSETWNTMKQATNFCKEVRFSCSESPELCPHSHCMC
jgi:hypothetical protein